MAESKTRKRSVQAVSTDHKSRPNEGEMSLPDTGKEPAKFTDENHPYSTEQTTWNVGVPEITDRERYPEGSPARTGKTTPPSGMGGLTPKSRPDHQDMFAPNPPPSEATAKKGEDNEAKGLVGPVQPKPA